MLGPRGAVTQGDVAWIVPVRVSSHGNSGSVGELLTFAYAAQGDGLPYRAQVLDIREGITASATSPRFQLGALAAGETLELFAHLGFTSGLTDLELFSAAAAAGGRVDNRGTISAANATGLYRITVTGPVTDDYWYIIYDPAAADFDAAVAAIVW